MTIIRAMGWLAAIAATAAAWATWRRPADPFAGLVVVRDATYGEADGRPLRLDLILPPGPADAPRPLVVAVHGGSWTGGSRRDYGPQFADLARDGLAVAVVDYRLARPGAPSWPGAVEDVRQAVDWLIDRADRHRIDPRRVALLGTSSGGLLAARAAQEDRRIAAVVCLSTPFDLAELAASRRLGHEPAELFLGADPTDASDLAADASPITHVTPGGPPTLMIHGDDDAWVPLDQARKMLERLETAGVPARLVVIPGARHGFELRVGPPEPRDLAPVVREFLGAAWAGGGQPEFEGLAP
ncbi:alpha/beta hydrolase [Paludisphaera sp.]|uniref:alpha/beta hydrolase n=1 Tax=Paludisphaera sp. TaxID=2017432 RepID=UPI00301CEAC1